MRVACTVQAKAIRRSAAAILAAGLWSSAAVAEPVELKLAFFASDSIPTYIAGAKPFVDAINADGGGLLSIKVYPDGALGAAVADQPQLVLDGRADIAFVVPGQTPYRFPDNLLLEMPGVFRDAHEATLAYTRLIAAGSLRGYEDFFVIGAYATDPSIIHSRKPVTSLHALQGMKIRANNPIEAESIGCLGAIPTVMPAPMLADALAKDTVEGAIMSPAAIFQFGAAKVANNHYVLGIGSAPLVLVMNRKKFESLSGPAQALIRKHSGEWTAAAWIGSFGVADREVLRKMRSDPQRKVVDPSPADLETAQRIYRSIIEGWAAKSPHNRELLRRLEVELAAIRSAK